MKRREWILDLACIKKEKKREMRNKVLELSTGWPAVSAHRLGGPWPWPGAVWVLLGYRRGGGRLV